MGAGGHNPALACLMSSRRYMRTVKECNMSNFMDPRVKALAEAAREAGLKF